MIFIDNNVLELASQLTNKFRYHLQHLDRIEKQVVEIHRVRFRQFLLICGIVARIALLVGKFRIHRRHFRSLQSRLITLVQNRILVTRNCTVHFFQFCGIVIVAQIVLQDFLENPLLVVIIVNRKVCIEPLAAKRLNDKIFSKAELQKL